MNSTAIHCRNSAVSGGHASIILGGGNGNYNYNLDGGDDAILGDERDDTIARIVVDRGVMG